MIDGTPSDIKHRGHRKGQARIDRQMAIENIELRGVLLTDRQPEQPTKQQQQQRKAESEGDNPSPSQETAAACGAAKLLHHGDIDIVHHLLALERLTNQVVELFVGKVIYVWVHIVGS